MLDVTKLLLGLVDLTPANYKANSSDIYNNYR